MKTFRSYLPKDIDSSIDIRVVGINGKTCGKEVFISQTIVVQNSNHIINSIAQFIYSLGDGSSVLVDGSLQNSLVRLGLKGSRAKDINSVVFTAFGIDLSSKLILSVILCGHSQS